MSERTAEPCVNPAVLDLWHPLATVAEIAAGEVHDQTLLGSRLSYAATPDAQVTAWRSDPLMPSGAPFDPSAVAAPLPLLVRYGYAWVSLGSPPADVFEIPEWNEPDRRSLHAGTIGVHCSGPRAVENFLDMGHFPYVHAGMLGIEPHTEVVEYRVEVDPVTNELWAKDCFFYQPMAAASSTDGQMSEYTYRVPHPFCVLLYKTSPLDSTRLDVIGLFARSVTADYIEASMVLSLLDDVNSDTAIRRFQQTIFAQDKPILENQHPKLLPLDPRAETPIRADKVAIAYRRWLSELGVTYGVLPAA